MAVLPAVCFADAVDMLQNEVICYLLTVFFLKGTKWTPEGRVRQTKAITAARDALRWE